MLYSLANPVTDDPNGPCMEVAVYFTVYTHSKFAVCEIISLQEGSFVLGYFYCEDKGQF